MSFTRPWLLGLGVFLALLVAFGFYSYVLSNKIDTLKGELDLQRVKTLQAKAEATNYKIKLDEQNRRIKALDLTNKSIQKSEIKLSIPDKNASIEKKYNFYVELFKELDNE